MTKVCLSNNIKQFIEIFRDFVCEILPPLLGTFSRTGVIAAGSNTELKIVLILLFGIFSHSGFWTIMKRFARRHVTNAVDL